MGKNKKTRWRSFPIDESQDETLVSGTEGIKVNGISDSHPYVDSHQKYSQILGDHHINNFTTQLSNKSTSSTTSSQHQIYKARSYNNKENYYHNQRGSLRGGPKSGWQRSNSSINNYRATAFSSKDRRTENGKSGSISNGGDEEGKEPIKFNEDEYTRITTPRQDVLFKKGYLSNRMISKTANSTISSPMATITGEESTAPNSTATNSDPDSSVSTLSPATTPSMDYAQQDPMEYVNAYYQGYYDENGMLVIPMAYNGFNYFSPNGSATNSPLYILPYPYPYDSFFMTPNTEVPVSTATETDLTTNDGDDEDGNENKKAESDHVKEENNQQSEEQTTSESKDVKHEEQQSNENTTATSEIDGGDQMKQNFPVYANELGYVYTGAAYPNGYNFYYYNGMPVNRPPPKNKRRKRYMSSRSSTSHPPRSAETTTDYSDDDNSSQHHHQPHQPHFNRRYHYSRHPNHNGWYIHNNGYNPYHYNNSKYSYNNNKYHYQSTVEQNANLVSNELPQELSESSNLNVDVQEFYPRVQPLLNGTKDSGSINQSKSKEQPESKCDVPAKGDLEQKATKVNGNKTSQQPQAQQSLPPPLPVRATKKEIMEGTKSMEQQNINLIQCNSLPSSAATQDVEWNVIKKGKKVKIAKNEMTEQDTPTKSKDTPTEVVSVVNIQESINISEVIVAKKATSNSLKVSAKKSKGKNKKKKSQHMMTKQQDGFEIIEPQFGNASKSEDDNNVESGEDEDNNVIEDTIEKNSTEITVASETIVEKMELLNVNEPAEDVILKLISDLQDDDAVIDISDEEICRESPIELNLAEIAQELIESEKAVEVQEPVCEQISEVIVKDLETSNVDAKESSNSQQDENIDELHLPVELDNSDSYQSDPVTPTFNDINFFGDHKNIAELERDLIENLRNMDDGIDIKSPLINPLYDFPITTAVSKWLQEKQNESFDSLFHVQNFKKLSELYDEYDGESDISESPMKSETTDSDYGSDCQVKANGSPTSSKSAKNEKKQTIKGTSNKLKIVKESFCALM